MIQSLPRHSLTATTFIIASLWLSASFAQADPIPLDNAANRPFVDRTPSGDGKGGWTDQGPENSLTGFPTGQVEFRGISFQIPDSGDQAIVFHGKETPDLPGSVTVQAPNGISGSTLYLLGAAAWGGGKYALAAEVYVNYSDGSTEKKKLIYDDHLGGWWEPGHVSKGTVVWRGKNKVGASIGIYMAPLKLRRSSGKQIQSVRIEVPSDVEPTLMITGMAAGDVPPSEILPPKPSWEDWEGNEMDDWFELPLPYDTLDKPAYWESAYQFYDHVAGKKGWTVANGENLEFKNGDEVRFHGIAATDSFFTPSKLMAEKYAKALRKYGFNQVRFHSIMDVLLKSKDGYKIPEFHERKLKRFDGIFAELKKHGIYIKPSMHFSTLWHPDLVEDGDRIGKLNNTQYYYDERHQELYIKVLKKFLNHRNEYTGKRYADDPALNMFKIVNESSMFFHTVDASPGSYLVKLQNKYNQWLKYKYGSPLKLIEAWSVEGEERPLKSGEALRDNTVALLGIGNLSHVSKRFLKRARDQTEFYYKLEQQWGKRVVNTIRDLGSQTLVQLSSWGGPGYLQEIQTFSNASDLFDFNGKHGYWLHPHGGWSPMETRFGNQSIFKNAEQNLFYNMYQHVAGKPFAITEWNFTFPNDYVNEAGPVMAAVGAMQNIAATHRFNLTRPEKTKRMNELFDVFHQVGSVMLEPLAHFIFVRGDVKPAPVVFQNAMNREELHDPTRKRGDDDFEESSNRFYMKFSGQGVPKRTLFVGGVRLSNQPDKNPDIWKKQEVMPLIDEESQTITSITGELFWDEKTGSLSIRTPKTRAYMGFFDHSTYRHGPLTMKLNDAYGVASFVSLDNEPLEQSEEILINLVGRQRNTGQQYRYFNTHGVPGYNEREAYSLKSLGNQPIRMEPAKMSFELDTELRGGQWMIGPLDMNGYARPQDMFQVDLQNGKIKADLSNKKFKTTNFILRRTK